MIRQQQQVAAEQLVRLARQRARKAVRAADLEAAGSMAALLRDALLPNLVQTLERTPAFVHGGPFANIAHGCNSVIATRAGLRLADYVVTEAGFGADLGAEKFFDIKCRKAGLAPAAAVLVATVRALKSHGGVSREDLARPDLAALARGFANLDRHIGNMGRFGVPLVIAINHFGTDTPEELDAMVQHCSGSGVEAVVCRHWAEGGRGAEVLARHVLDLADSGRADFRTLYPDDASLWEKARTIARDIYGAEDIAAEPRVREQFAAIQEAGYGHVPVCMAKTQYSFSADPALKGAPSGHIVPIRELRLAAGAEFVVAICGDIMTMPGLPRRPAACDIRVNAAGEIEGLF